MGAKITTFFNAKKERPATPLSSYNNELKAINIMRGPVHQSETNSTHTAAIRWKNRKFGARLPQGRSACSWKCPGKNIIVEWALMEMAMDFYLLSTHNICCRPLPFFSTFGVNHLVQISRKCLGKICKSCSELSGF